MNLDRLLKLQDIIKEMAGIRNANLKMTDYHWSMIKDLRDLLAKAFDVMKKLQFDSCSPGSFYRKWGGLRFCYENQGSVLATEIANSMKGREQDLLDGDLLNAGVLLDMFNAHLLSKQDQKGGNTLVCSLVLKMKGLESEDDEEEVALEVMSTPDTDSDEEMRVLRGILPP